MADTGLNETFKVGADVVEVEDIAVLETIHKEAARGRTPRWLALLYLWSMLGGYNMGYGNSIIASSLSQPTFSTYFGMDTNPHAAAILGAAGCFFNVGGFFGVFFISFCMDRWGRKIGLYTACGCSIVGLAITGGSAANIGMFIFGRWLTGFGGWGSCMAALIYESEISITETRGFLSGCTGTANAVGYAIAAWVGVGIFYLDTPDAWRAPLLIGIIFPLTMVILLPFVPESPRWLAARGETDQVHEICKKIHKSKADPDHIYANLESREIIMQADLERHLDSSWRIMFTKRSYLKRLIFAALVTSTMNFSGIQAVTSFGPAFYKSLGYGAADQLFFSAGWITISPLESILMMYLCDKMGRVAMVSLGGVNSALTMSVYAALVATYGDSDNRAGKAAAVAMIYIFLVGYLFNEIATYVYVSEIFPTHIRTKGVAFAIAASCVQGSWVIGVTPTGIANLGWKYNLIYIFLAFTAGVTCFIILPETKGIPLERVARLFGDKDEVVDVEVHQSDLHHIEKPVTSEKQSDGGTSV
ncbi:MFS general substrate transporter [Calocera viscosa TUFC12733]|uniref:MFS general substrate transporter n=1 Tax=Calocera viscosa (strain TUFC12733) TaxID=1330018 RepID=A0A167FS82_CALVF|nr:MFS general substrate transporter [Calocera viscosa TUFC12733]